MTSKTVLVTGGLGYIGTHTCVELFEAGFKVIVVDNLSNSSIEALKRLKQLIKIDIPFYKIDIRDKDKLEAVFNENVIDSVIHFAGLKSLNESIKNPIEYYDNNIIGTITLAQVMKKFDCKTFVFSSSATVYGNPNSLPIKEDFPLSVTNPYGRSKLIIEELLKDIFSSDSSWQIALLRYFNPVGAHKSGLIGEDSVDAPNNLMPFISQVAIGKRNKLRIFGGDYETHDGTGVRDYIHITDLSKGHIKALEALDKKPQVLIANLGTGNGYSVLDMVKAFEIASGCDIPFEIVDRREGDVAECYADPTLAKMKLHWEAQLGLNEMCKDTWNWQSMNPHGYS